jgi:hypothetical protein
MVRLGTPWNGVVGWDVGFSGGPEPRSGRFRNSKEQPRRHGPKTRVGD